MSTDCNLGNYPTCRDCERLEKQIEQAKIKLLLAEKMIPWLEKAIKDKCFVDCADPAGAAYAIYNFKQKL